MIAALKQLYERHSNDLAKLKQTYEQHARESALTLVRLPGSGRLVMS